MAISPGVGCNVMSTIVLLLHRGSPVDQQWVVERLAEEFHDHGHEVRILRSGLLSLFFRSLWTHADIVDVHDVRLWMSAWVLRVAHPSTRLTATIHRDLMHAARIGLSQRLFARIGTAFAFRFADDIITTRKTLQYLFLHTHNRLVTFIPYGSLPLVSTRASSLKRKKNHLVAIGRESRKIRAISVRTATHRRLPVLSLTLPASGYPVWAVELQKSARSAAAYVIPEPTPPLILRTIATLGIPVIALDLPDHREIFGADARYVRSGTRAELAAAVTDVVTQKQWGRRAHTLRRRTASVYAWKDIAEEFLRAYHPEGVHSVPVDSLTPSFTSTSTR